MGAIGDDVFSDCIAGVGWKKSLKLSICLKGKKMSHYYLVTVITPTGDLLQPILADQVTHEASGALSFWVNEKQDFDLQTRLVVMYAHRQWRYVTREDGKDDDGATKTVTP